MTEAIPILEARGVGRRESKTNNWLLRDISLQIHGGDRLAIVGATGAGKTLLLRALALLDRPDVGQILWRGKRLAGDAVPRFRREAIYLQQRPALIEGTVEDNLRFPFTLRANADRHYSRELAVTLLARVGRAESFLGRSARDLSGGEAQFVALLRAIQLQPVALFLDEPTAALDEESTRAIERLVDGWFAGSAAGRAFVWVTHDRQQTDRLSAQVKTMKAGQLSAEKDGEGEPVP